MQEAFLAGGAITITEGRGSAVDFSYPYFETKIGFTCQKPSPLPKYQAIFWPFQLDLWIVLILALALFSLFYGVLVRYVLKDTSVTSPALNAYATMLSRGKLGHVGDNSY